MGRSSPYAMPARVAPLAGSVDRNSVAARAAARMAVAPLAGSVDRNIKTEAGAGDNPCRSPRGERG